MSARARRHHRKGAIVEIDLGVLGRTYARLLEPPLAEFLDVVISDAAEPTDHERIKTAPVLFRINIMRSSWPIVIMENLTDVEPMPVMRYFRQDALTGELSIVTAEPGRTDRSERPATLAECEKLEPWAVWDISHVEDRLRDHVLGVPNKWVTSLRPRNSG